jgi:16S rRNA processing protein RimM
MQTDNCFEIGKIIKAHGTKGELQIALLVEQAPLYFKKESIFVGINNKLVPFFIEDHQIINPNKAILKLEDINTALEAESLCNLYIYLPLHELPVKTDEHYFYHQIIQYQIIDDSLGELGYVSEVLEMPGQDMIEMIYQNTEILIPLNEDIVYAANHSQKQLMVRLPEGLLEIYLNPKTEIPDDAD